MAEPFEITDEMRSHIGVESEPWTYELTTTSVRAFARGVGYADPVYYDVGAAREAGYRSLPAPPTYLGTPVFIPGSSSEVFSGPIQSGGPHIGFGFSQILDGGTETEYFESICAGDTLRAVSRLSGLDRRRSPSLGSMLISTTETVYRNQDGVVVAIQRARTILY